MVISFFTKLIPGLTHNSLYHFGNTYHYNVVENNYNSNNYLENKIVIYVIWNT